MSRFFAPRFLLFLTIIGLVTASLTSADSIPTNYFYHDLPYGSQANFTPLNVIINGGYGILQIPYYTNDEYQRRIFAFPYNQWARNVWQTVGHPLRTLDEFGWQRFLTSEILPLTLLENNNQWVPNYFLHTIAAGMLSRATEEWFRHQGLARPRAWSIATMVVYHGLSEIVENRGNTALTVDHLADLYIFDPLGIILFTSDRVCGFFSRHLHLAEWSMQPAGNVVTGNLENMGQFYVVKISLPGISRWQAFIHFGLHGMAGFSRDLASGRALSAAAGFMVEDLVPVEADDPEHVLTGVLTWRAGLFYDRNNSLQASLLISNVPQRRLIFNLYPSAWHIGPVQPGIFLMGTHEWTVGISINLVSFGLAASNK